jgi:hypothetical protein
VKAHSTVVRFPGSPHSTRIRLFGSMDNTVTNAEAPYISHSHQSCLPASSLPLLFVNQNFVVMSGSTKASKTSPTGRRMSIPVLATGM